MADTDRKLSNGNGRIDFATEPSRYRHWKLSVEGDVATLLMDVDENAPLFEGYQLKLNSYDLGVDIELADAVRRLRFEHPQVKARDMLLAQQRPELTVETLAPVVRLSRTPADVRLPPPALGEHTEEILDQL